APPAARRGRRPPAAPATAPSGSLASRAALSPLFPSLLQYARSRPLRLPLELFSPHIRLQPDATTWATFRAGDDYAAATAGLNHDEPGIFRSFSIFRASSSPGRRWPEIQWLTIPVETSRRVSRSPCDHPRRSIAFESSTDP